MTLIDLWETALVLGLPPNGTLLVVDVKAQKLRLINQGSLCISYPVSTSAYGVGAALDSFKTPPGWHRISERIGDGEAKGQVFKNRDKLDKIWSASDKPTGKSMVLSRILWLDGLEEGINRGGDIDFHERYIYIHGTNWEDKIGTPHSHGCIQMRNKDVIDLFEQIKKVSAWCWIGELNPS